MSDYIDILLTALEDELFPSLGKDYFLSLQQANDACDRAFRHPHRSAACAAGFL